MQGALGSPRGDHVDLEEGELLDRFSVHLTSDRVHMQARGSISGAENRVSGSQETLEQGIDLLLVYPKIIKYVYRAVGWRRHEALCCCQVERSKVSPEWANWLLSENDKH